MPDSGRSRGADRISTLSVPDSSPGLADLSPGDKPWDKHRGNADIVAALYSGSEFQRYSDRVNFCSEFLQFGLVDADNESLKLKLRSARFCRVRHCPVCQWRRSLMWKAKVFKVLPKVVEKYPKYRWLFVTLTVKNVPIAHLRDQLHHMNKSYRRMTHRKFWPAVGWLRSTEVTRSRDGLAHPHFHCLAMVKPGYFGKDYIKKADWIEIWRKALQVDYKPIMDVRAVRKGEQPSSLVPELLKYCTKESDLVADREWFLELTRQLHKLRTIATGGVLKEYFRELEEEPEDLIGESDTPESEDLMSLYFGWERRDKQYRMVDN